MDVTGSEELREFLDSWQDDPLNIKKSFTEYMDFLAAHSNMSFTFKARPGVSYSLRARHSVQTQRVRNDGAQHHRNRKGHAKAHADERHRFGAVLLAG